MYNCRICSIELQLGINLSENDLNYRIYLCTKCKSERSKNYKKSTNYNLIKTLNSRKIFFDKLGSSCDCCSEDVWQFLTLDHINNDGYKDKQRIGSNSLYRFLNKENLSRFQTLCMNCNYSKGHNGFCPHKIISNNTNCINCNIYLNGDNQLKINKKYHHSICNICLLDQSITLNKNIDPIKKLLKKEQTLNIKNNIIENYGNCCACCKENNILLLTIDHIGGGGRKENKKLKKYGTDFYYWLKSNNYPQDKYQLLCYNCNCCKSIYGQCYHSFIKEKNIASYSIDDHIAFLKSGLSK